MEKELVKLQQNMEMKEEKSVLATVIIASYNVEKYIKEAVDSILCQSYADFELFIIDDASTDKTWEIIQQFADSRIRVFRNEKNLGQTKCLNFGIKQAQGKYVLIMDSDDIAHPDRLKVQIEYMEEHGDTVLAGAWLQCFGKQHNIIQSVQDYETLRARFIFDNVISNGTFIIRKEILDTYNISYNEEIRYAQDYCLAEEMSCYGKVTVIPKVLLRYRIHNSQVSSSKRVEQWECANVTRRRILERLNVHLTREEFFLWAKFCVNDSTEVTAVNKTDIVRIIEQIKRNNAELGLYNSEKLGQELDRKLAIWNFNAGLPQVDEKWLLMIDVFDKWLKYKQEGGGYDTYFKRRGYKSIAIYGLAELGKRLYDELENTDIEVKYFMDRNSVAFYKDLVRREIESGVSDVDVLVITPMHCFDAVREQVDIAEDVKVISLQDVVYDI